MISKYNIILGSGSPRRKQILSSLGLNFKIQIPNIDESSDRSTPAQICEHISIKKFKDIQQKVNDEKAIIITGDTIVCLHNEVFGKPKNREDAYSTLELLSGKEHLVISSLCVGFNNCDTYIINSEVTKVKFLELDKVMINNYLDQNSYMDKAGSYAIQDPNCFFVSSINGSLSNVIGLPIELFKSVMGKLIESKYENPNWKKYV